MRNGSGRLAMDLIEIQALDQRTLQSTDSPGLQTPIVLTTNSLLLVTRSQFPRGRWDSRSAMQTGVGTLLEVQC